MPIKRKGADLSRSTSKARNLRNNRSERTEEQIQQQNNDALYLNNDCLLLFLYSLIVHSAHSYIHIYTRIYIFIHTTFLHTHNVTVLDTSLLLDLFIEYTSLTVVINVCVCPSKQRSTLGTISYSLCTLLALAPNVVPPENPCVIEI